MKTTYTFLAGVLLAFLLSVSLAFAQDTEVPPTMEATVEVTVEPVPVEPAPVETVDVHNWFDDLLEGLGKIDVATLALGIGLVTLALQIRKPQTSEEKRLRDEELTRKEAEVRLTPSQIDDLMVLLSRLANNLRPVADSVGATVSPPFTTSISDTPDTVIQTTTTTTVDNEPELRG